MLVGVMTFPQLSRIYVFNLFILPTHFSFKKPGNIDKFSTKSIVFSFCLSTNLNKQAYYICLLIDKQKTSFY